MPMCVDRCAEGWLSPRLQLHNHVSPEDLTEERKVGSQTLMQVNDGFTSVGSVAYLQECIETK